MRIGIHAPLDERRTGVAVYARTLGQLLARRAEVRWNPSEPCDVELYHLGNNALHRQAYEKAIERPGLVVLHDAVLNHFFLSTQDQQHYVAEFVYNYGAWFEDFARRLWRERARAAEDFRYFEYPMLRRVVERAKGVIVHNPAAARAASAHGARCVTEIPHLSLPTPAVPVAVREHLRRQLAGSGRGVLFGVFGFLRETKRLVRVLEVFRRLESSLPEARLLVAGRFVSEELARACEPYFRMRNVIRVGFLSERELSLYVAAIDVGINLRWPTAGETSGMTIRLMSSGKAVVVSDTLENARWPEDCVVRIPTGVEESDALEFVIRWLTRFPEDAQEIGRRAARYVTSVHGAEHCAEGYWDAIQVAVTTVSR